MNLPKVHSLSYLSLAGVVLLIGGLGLALFASQQQQDNRSQASEPLNDNAIVVTNYTNDYSGTQGHKGWYYGYSNGGFDGTNFEQMSIHSGGNWYVDPNKYWIQIRKDAMHPNSTKTSYPNQPAWFDVIKRWESTVSGEVTISGKVADGDASNSAADVDGVWFSIWLDGQKIHEGYVANGNTSGVTYSLTKTVDVGSKIDFAVGSDKSDYNDTVIFDVIITKEEPPVVPQATTFNFDLLLNGIGKAGDSKNPDDWEGNNQDPEDKTRSVEVQIRDIDDNSLVVSGEDEVTYNLASGSYKGTVKIDSGLTNEKTYKIWVKLSHSIWNRESVRKVTLGQTHTIPQLTLKNGDANGDGFLTFDDYNIIRDCYFDPDIDTPPKNCNSSKKEQADINDDGDVNHFDLSLLLREMSVQD